jgi:hypothetical protein
LLMLLPTPFAHFIMKLILLRASATFWKVWDRKKGF